VVLIVRDIRPPFLDGRIVFTTQTEPVQVVRDPTSDFAKIAKKGSQVLRKIRERNDRAAMRERFWELAGSKLGNILKVQKEEKEEQKEEVDYKADSQYA